VAETAETIVTAGIIIIGDEVLSGRTQDLNLAFLARALNEIGIRVAEGRVIPDTRERIVATVNACRARFSYVFTTGGIGPTHDDITAASIAAAFGVRLCRNPDAVRLLERQYAPADRNAARMRMADVPEGASLIANPVSGAPGFRIENVFVLPGVPRIMQAMFDGLRNELVGGDPVLSRSVAAFTTEGSIATPLAALQAAHERVSIGSYPFVRGGRLGTSLVLRSTDAAALDRAMVEVMALVRAVGVEPTEEPTV
jgi:molybdenum cofactor synthesis domain-containing protein